MAQLWPEIAQPRCDMPLGADRVTIDIDGDALAVRGLPRDITLVRPVS